MTSYITNHKSKFEESKKIDLKFHQFCKSLYETKTLSISPEEKQEFEHLRLKENEDYNFRKKIFWPAWALGLLFFDQLFTIPSSKGNKIRIFTNLVLGVPFVSIAVSGLIFYREKIESHEYALSLCEKYNSCKDPSEEVNPNESIL
jgi:hypothetical protein